MRITRLYTQQVLRQGTTLQLAPEQAHYLANVLRAQSGDSVRLFNDGDEEYEARLIKLSKKQAKLELLSVIPGKRESPLQLNVAIGIARGAHMDLAIQKAVELGVTCIIPLITEYSNVKIKPDRIQNKMTHWSNIIISATEQCGRTRLTQIAQPIRLDEFLIGEAEGQRLLFHPEAETTIAELDGKPDNVTLLIGPEGGFSEDEVTLAIQHGCQTLYLGPRVLRAETAVVAAVACCQGQWGDLFSLPDK